MGHDGTPITDFGVLPLIPMSGKGIIGEYVSIIQHPEGGTKQVVVRENQIIALDRPVSEREPGLYALHGRYRARLLRLAGLQRSMGSDRDPSPRNRRSRPIGEPLNKRGEVWTEADGDRAKNWIANEGVRISAIWAHLRAAAPFDGDAARIVTMLAFEPRGARMLRAARTSGREGMADIPGVPDVDLRVDPFR